MKWLLQAIYDAFFSEVKPWHWDYEYVKAGREYYRREYDRKNRGK